MKKVFWWVGGGWEEGTSQKKSKSLQSTRYLNLASRVSHKSLVKDKILKKVFWWVGEGWEEGASQNSEKEKLHAISKMSEP